MLEQEVLLHESGSPSLGMHAGLRQKDLEIWHQGCHGLAYLSSPRNLGLRSDLQMWWTQEQAGFLWVGRTPA